MKRSRIIFLITVLAVLLTAVLASCSINPEANSDGYVEVTQVRVPDSDVYLAPTGDPATYQLMPTVLPVNATNQKVNYYVEPELFEYFTVSKDGLITAKKITEELTEAGKTASIRIYSTSNPKAEITVKVYIENVSVNSIKFVDTEGSIINTDEVSLYAETHQLNLKFEPYHAINGRDVRFTSLNEAVATVDSSTGLLTPVSQGTATILATGMTVEGKTIEGRLTVTVRYKSGKYRLDVTGINVKYEHTISKENLENPGSNKDVISFNIAKLDPDSDPNPEIKWSINGVRDSSKDNEWTYEYVPTAETPMKIIVSATIRPKAEQAVTLYSEDIWIYWEFSGFDLKLKEPERDKYIYGETAVLTPALEAISPDMVFEWYIKAAGEKGYGEYIGSSNYAVDSGEFRYTIDKEGSQVVTVVGRAGNSTVFDTINMNIVRYAVGDKIVAQPETKENEKIPESYDWYLHSYENGTPSATGVLLSTTSKNTTFVYDATAMGTYVLYCIPTVGGLPDYEKAEYSVPFSVGERSGQSNIYDITVDAVLRGSELMTMISWNTVGGVNEFTVEAVCGGVAYIISSSDGDKNSLDAIIRDYSILFPSSKLPLSKDIRVRVRQNGSSFSTEYLYKANSVSLSIDEKYFSEVFDGINRSITDMTELGELLNYINMYRPNIPGVIDLAAKTAESEIYNIEISTKLLYSNLNAEIYPVLKAYNDANADNAKKNIFNLVCSAFYAYCDGELINLYIDSTPVSDVFVLRIVLGPRSGSFLHEPSDTVFEKLSDNVFVVASGDERGVADFNITLKSGENVSSASEYYAVAMSGRNPVPVARSEAETLHAEITDTLNSILTDTMTQKQKVLAIYNYLVTETEYDTKVYALSQGESKPADLYDYDSYHASGVFLSKKAVAEGFVKAFNLMCAMEGITSVGINGRLDGKRHCWNRVYLEGQWYNIDAVSGRIQEAAVDGMGRFLVSYRAFLVSDAVMTGMGYSVFGEYAEAKASIDLDDGLLSSVYSAETADGVTAVLTEIKQNLQSSGYCSYEILTPDGGASYTECVNEVFESDGLDIEIFVTARGFILIFGGE